MATVMSLRRSAPKSSSNRPISSKITGSVTPRVTISWPRFNKRLPSSGPMALPWDPAFAYPSAVACSSWKTSRFPADVQATSSFCFEALSKVTASAKYVSSFWRESLNSGVFVFWSRIGSTKSLLSMPINALKTPAFRRSRVARNIGLASLPYVT